MKGVIRLGDSTTHGGKVLSASSTLIVFNKGVARVGDMVTCPYKGHGVNPIIEGDPLFNDQGKPIAFHGHKTACGCKLISSLSNFGIKK
ncbi:PAAR domain-containing protein [Frischella sp. Ac13]|uniref:PAAR domain-containing protein n=1 Tax=Frischella japonica TaxID=2741544 RepID=A0ABR7QWD8_9GAMM|nr:PAAR domain-containing protein [Frischella japonica]MBC9130440.1 PAAR domain-containing protein [Frischella japonica]